MGMLLVGPSGPADPGHQGLIEAGREALGRPSAPRLGRLAALRRSSVVAFVGGTPLAPGPGCSVGADLRRALRLARLTRLAGGSFVLLGVGALPADGAAGRAMARVADRADLLVLRDEPSAAALRTAGASGPFRVGADPTWTLLDRKGGAPLERAADQARTGAVVVGGGDGAARLGVILGRLGHRSERLGWGGGARRGRRAAAPGLVAVRDRMAGAEVVMTSRFHAMVAAAAAGTPCVGVGDDAGLAALAGRLGQPWVPATVEPGQVEDAVAAAVGGGPAGPPAVKAEVARAEEGFRLARLVISGGDSEDAETVVGLPLEARPWV